MFFLLDTLLLSLYLSVTSIASANEAKNTIYQYNHIIIWLWSTLYTRWLILSLKIDHKCKGLSGLVTSNTLIPAHLVHKNKQNCIFKVSNGDLKYISWQQLNRQLQRLRLILPLCKIDVIIHNQRQIWSN